MTDYTKSTNFASKDSLSTGNALKIIKGTELDAEFNNISTAVATKANLLSPTFTGTPVLPTGTLATTQSAGNNTTAIATTAFVKTAIDAIPVSVTSGSMLMWPTATAPSGYLLCNGQAVSRSTYATLFAVTSTVYGVGDGSTTFNVPDLRDRFPIGAGTTYSAGGTGGSADAIVVSHTHTATSTVTDPSHSHSASGIVGVGGGGFATSSPGTAASGSVGTGSSSTGISVATTNASTGSSGTGANLPPYLGIHFIIKT